MQENNEFAPSKAQAAYRAAKTVWLTAPFFSPTYIIQETVLVFAYGIRFAYVLRNVWVLARNMWRIQPLGFRKSSAQTLALSCIYTSSSLLASPCPCSCPCPDHYVSFAFLILLGYPTRTWICPTAWTDLPSYFPTSHFLSLSLCLISLMILAPDQLYGTSGLAVEWRLWLHLALVYEPAKTNIGWMNERLIERMPPPLMISLTCMSNSRCCFRAWETCPFRARWALDDCWVCSLHVVRTLKLCSSVFPTSWKHELPNAALEK